MTTMPTWSDFRQYLEIENRWRWWVTSAEELDYKATLFCKAYVSARDNGHSEQSVAEWVCEFREEKRSQAIAKMRSRLRTTFPSKL